MSELDLSSRAAGRRGGISHTVVASIRNGTHRHKVSDDTIRALALALDLPVSQLYAAAGVEPEEPEWRMPNRLRALDPELRAAVEKIADDLLRIQRRQQSRDGH